MKNRFVKLTMSVVLILALLVPAMVCAEYENGDPPLTVEVELLSNPSTGYSWTFECDNTSVLDVYLNGFYTENEGLVGAPGIEDFSMSGLAEGIANVTFNYVKGDEEPLFTIEYVVYVNENGDVMIYDATFSF